MGAHLRSLAIPMAIGFVAMNSYAIADTYFVGQLGTLPLAAMGFTFPVAFAMISVGLGVGIATSSIVARLLGAGNRETVQRIVTHAIILGFVLGVMLLAIGLGTMEPMFRALGADERTLPLIGQYMRVYYFGSAFVILPMVGNFAIRATGNALAPSLIMVFAALTNIVLDPLLIFGLLGFPRLELAGAAIATVVSNVATVAASMAVLYYRERLILPRYLRLKGLWDSWSRLLYVAIPATITNLLVPVIIAFITALVAGFGPEAVAGFGVASRLESVVWIVIFALQSSLAPFVGQNYGAFLMDRVRHATNLSNKFFLAYSLVMAAVLFLVAQPVASIFDDNPLVVSAAVSYLRIVPISYGAFGLMMVTVACFNALGRPKSATLLTFVKLFVVYLPMAWLLSIPFGLTGIFIATAIAHILFGVVSVVWLRSFLRELEGGPAAVAGAHAGN
ncbi:MAG: MATE family efflux transporter [Rhodospirillaceae bacterium]|nr:MATE family efflux transporter [Rhodospirillaceae bacterium]